MIIPLSYYFIERNVLLVLLFIFSAMAIMIDIFRRHNEKIGNIYNMIFGDILREHEVNFNKIFFTGGTYILISFFICILFFNKEIAILSMLIIVISDTAAAVTGKTIGKRKIGTKTLEGGIAFFVTAMILFFIVIKPNDLTLIYIGFLSVFLTAVFELIPLKADDNITIPLFFGIVYSAMTNTKLLI